MSSIDICEFTLPHYRRILEKVLALGFEVLCLEDTKQLEKGRRQLILRHDLDFSVRHAVRMAALEKALGVRASYCVFLHSPTYNIGDVETLELLFKIREMGHEIALHYEAECFEKAGIEFLEGVDVEAKFLGKLFGRKIRSVSQHRPALKVTGIWHKAASSMPTAKV